MTPVPDGFTPETPDANKLGTRASAINGKASVPMQAFWVEGAKRYDINQETNFGGTFKGRAFIPGLSLTYIFEKERKGGSILKDYPKRHLKIASSIISIRYARLDLLLT
ncbi:MAG: hypothetical protein U0176_12830 [Bacteroidia bacterium]